jgi:transcriptional regulator with XRE-family HTH domain
MSSNCVAIHSTKPRSAKQPRAASSSVENPTPAGQTIQSLRIAPGKILKAEAMVVEGCSQREIARELHMSGHTVAKIIRSEDFQNFIRQQREQLFAIAPVALDSVRAGVMTDSHLAYAFLKDLGIVPSRDAMLNLAHVEPPAPSIEDRQSRQIRMIAAVIEERHRVFGIELPDDIEQAIEKEADLEAEELAGPS